MTGSFALPEQERNRGKAEEEAREALASAGGLYDRMRKADTQAARMFFPGVHAAGKRI